MKWLAIYMPEWGVRPDKEFDSEDDAWDYIKNNHLCKPGCDSCLAEWAVCEKDKYEQCDNFEEFMTDGLGYKVVYRNPSIADNMIKPEGD